MTAPVGELRLRRATPSELGDVPAVEGWAVERHRHGEDVQLLGVVVRRRTRDWNPRTRAWHYRPDRWEAYRSGRGLEGQGATRDAAVDLLEALTRDVI